MPQYGKLKIDQFLYNDSGTDVTLDLANIASRGANTFTGNQSLGDGLKVQFGASNDLQIWHNGSNSYIKDGGTGRLRLLTNSFRIADTADSENMIAAEENGAVGLYYDNSKKFETTSGGIDVDGSVTADDIITAGALLHEGDTDTLVHFSAANTIDLKTGGVTRLTVNNTGVNLGANLYTSGKNISLGDSSGATDDRITVGDSQDLQIYHDGTNSYITNGSDGGTLYIQTYGENSGKFFPNGATEVFYDGSKKFETTSTGAKCSGTLNSAVSSTGIALQVERTGTANGKYGFKLLNDSGNDCSLLLRDEKANVTRLSISSAGNAAFTGDVDLADNKKLKLGTGDDLQIYHNGSNSFIENTTGNLIVKDTTGTIYLQSTRIDFESEDGEQIAHFISDGAVELYYDNSKKLETTSGGVNVTGALTVNGTALSTSPTITATASGSIAAGKAVVINSSGQVKQPAQTFTAEDPVDDSSAVASTSNDGGNSAATDNLWDHTRSAYDPISGRAMFPYNHAGNSSRWTAGTIKATTTSDVWVTNYKTVQTSDKQAVWNIGENKFLIYYYVSSSARLRVVTLSGTGDAVSMSKGAHTVLSNQNGASPAFANMGGGLGVLALHDQGNGEYRTYVIQVASGGTGTTSSASSVQTLADDPDSDIKIMKHSSGKVVAMWKENDDGTRSIKTRVGTVSSGDSTVTWGTEQTAVSGNYSVRMTEAQTGANGEIIMMYDVSQQNIKYKIGTLSGTSISWGSEQTVIAGSATSNYHSFRDCCWDNSSGRVAILYSKTDSHVYIASASLSSGTLTKNTNHQEQVTGFATSSYPRIDEAWLNAATKTGNVSITARARRSSDNNRDLMSTTATLGSVGTELTTLEYVGISSAAYTNGQTATIDVTGGTNTAVSGLTAGSNYYVQGDGSLGTDTATPLIKAGLALSATKLLIKG